MKKKYLAPEFENTELWNRIAIMDVEKNGTPLEDIIESTQDPIIHTDEDTLDDE